MKNRLWINILIISCVVLILSGICLTLSEDFVNLLQEVWNSVPLLIFLYLMAVLAYIVLH